MSVLAYNREPTVFSKHVPVADPIEAFERAYSSLLEKSDFNCIKSLILGKEVEVVLEIKSRLVALVPTSKASVFLDAVFNYNVS